MTGQVSKEEERRFITKEFAESLRGKTPSPYFRLHDPVQKMLADRSASIRDQPLLETAYPDRMIHFWREVSLAGMPRTGRWMDESFALVFEATFDLAEAEPEWALECVDQILQDKAIWQILKLLARYTTDRTIGHASLVAALAAMYAPWRESDDGWKDECRVVASGSHCFWAGLLAASGVQEDHALWNFRCALGASSSRGWDDQRLHTRLIREAPARAEITPRIELMDHPILRLARLKYAEGSVEQNLVIRFLNRRCIEEGFESEEDYFGGDLKLGQWVRDAREWATGLLREDPEMCEAMFEASGADAIEGVRKLFRTEISPRPEYTDHFDATAALVRWAKRRRGFEYSAYRAQLWEIVVEVIDAALWLGWLFPPDLRKSRKLSARRLTVRVAEPQEVVVIGKQFGLFARTGEGVRFTPSTTVPLIENQSYGWGLRVDTKRSPLSVREELELPAAPKTWGPDVPGRTISEDGKTSSSTRSLTPDEGYLGYAWNVEIGDPEGNHVIRVFINDKFAAEFKFMVIRTGDAITI
jgi:hypothetical protein